MTCILDKELYLYITRKKKTTGVLRSIDSILVVGISKRKWSESLHNVQSAQHKQGSEAINARVRPPRSACCSPLPNATA